eukprot:GILI01008865.1.p1 GENE.GILI01008865.1~~GILI01008865.1.p1  ORF type:complete len:511 (+),score=140.71 GILI01008865.1:32-1534(+)
MRTTAFALISLALVATCAVATNELWKDCRVGYFLRNMEPTTFETALPSSVSKVLDGVTHYRLIPGGFPDGMGYHFDGLATVLAFKFQNGKMKMTARRYESGAAEHFNRCIFLGTGTGPTVGIEPCVQNPGVNLLPIYGQLWLTIDTALWGRVDPETLETVKSDLGKVHVPSTVLNAHPACDRQKNECFVQYPCSQQQYPLTNQACIGKLVETPEGGLAVEEYGRSTLPYNMFIQHSHSPAVTPNYVVSKLDSFGKRFTNHPGLLKLLHQVSDNLWMVMDRRDNSTRILSSGVDKFVNNHFWNAFEDKDGNLVVDAVAATDGYLDAYFSDNLAAPANWSSLFTPPLRCLVPPPSAAKQEITCVNLLPTQADVVFDYPTFNPFFKANPSSKFTYGIAPSSRGADWFDSLIKLDTRDRTVSKRWSAPDTFLTEATYVPSQSARTVEDSGALLSVMYHPTSDSSTLGVFDPASLKLLAEIPLPTVVPFHAHGISCVGGQCFTNP